MEQQTQTGSGIQGKPAVGQEPRGIPVHEVVLPSREPAVSVHLLHTYSNGTPATAKAGQNLSLDRIDQSRMAVEQLLERANLIMGDHKYVHFSLQDGRAIHMSKADDGVIIHAVSPGILPKEVRYSSIDDRSFLSMKRDNVHTIEIEEGALARTDVLLNDLEIFLSERANKPLVVQVSPQGYHENDINKLKLGLQDTGGQDKYINDSGFALTEMGYNVVNVNRAGPPHPTNGDVRVGMHYSHTGMDLLFVEDQLTDARHSQFISKEQMYPAGEWEGTPPTDPIFFGMARSLANHIKSEPQRRDFVLIGHYADGGTTAWHTARLIEEDLRSNPEKEDQGYKVPKVWYNAHSLGVLKQRALEAAGEAYDPNELRFDARHRFEQFLYRNVDGVLSTSDTMTRSMETDFGRKIDYFLPPGVDTHQFRPRREHVSRTDARYSDTWKLLTELSGQSIETLNNATLIMEVSRTAETKGKDDVLRAFAASLSEEDMRNDQKFLVINIADPNRENMQPSERELAQRIHRVIEELGIERWVITQNDFKPTIVAQLHQITDIFITGAISEPWGMSLQQAAASKQPVISTTRVPSGTQVLMDHARSIAVGEGSQSTSLTVGEGALFFEPTDHIAAAHAINMLIENPDETRAMAQRAYDLVIPKFTWSNQISAFIELGLRHRVGGDGKVEWPESSAIKDRITRPRWA